MTTVGMAVKTSIRKAGFDRTELSHRSFRSVSVLFMCDEQIFETG